MVDNIRKEVDMKMVVDMLKVVEIHQNLENDKQPGVTRNSSFRPVPGMKASDSRSRIMGMDFFHSLLIP